MSLNKEKPGPFVWFSTLQCRRFGRESVSYSETNWQGSFGPIHDYADRALRNRAPDVTENLTVVTRDSNVGSVSERWSRRIPTFRLTSDILHKVMGSFVDEMGLGARFCLEMFGQMVGQRVDKHGVVFMPNHSRLKVFESFQEFRRKNYIIGGEMSVYRLVDPPKNWELGIPKRPNCCR